jgi:mutator protein MutT
MKRFNIRVYGIGIRNNDEVLLSDESIRDFSFTKFPGGGLEWGEGTKDCLIREFREEFDLEIEVGELFYFTDFFQQSAFSEYDQVISVYYSIVLPATFNEQNAKGDKGETLRWKAIRELTSDDLTFPIDKKVAELLSNVV